MAEFHDALLYALREAADREAMRFSLTDLLRSVGGSKRRLADIASVSLRSAERWFTTAAQRQQPGRTARARLDRYTRTLGRARAARAMGRSLTATLWGSTMSVDGYSRDRAKVGPITMSIANMKREGGDRAAGGDALEAFLDPQVQ